MDVGARARYGGHIAVALGAAVISNSHQNGVLTGWDHTWLGATVDRSFQTAQ